VALPSPRQPEQARADLAGWLSARVGTEVTVGEVGGPPATGFSNETIIFDATWAEDGVRRTHDLVARVQPTSHTVFMDDTFEVQHQVLRALAGAPEVPVPRVRWFEPDAGVLGAPFMVMDAAPGSAPADSPPYSMEGWYHDAPPDVQAAVWWSGLDAMAAVHRVDWKALGLDALDPCPSGGSRLEAKLDQWERMLAWASPDEHHAVPAAALRWLRETRPPDVDDPALCWGDSRIGNQLFDGVGSADTVRVSAVLDWEMVHVGDPIQDLGWFTWLDHTLSAGLEQPRLAGLPSVEDTVARWERATGRSGEHHRWAEILAGLGFAVVMVRLTVLLKDAGLFPQDSDFARTNMACTALRDALVALDVHADDLT
jgi:aminoglycoside phosphotransferase (APT) family kinase protein